MEDSFCLGSGARLASGRRHRRRRESPAAAGSTRRQAGLTASRQLLRTWSAEGTTDGARDLHLVYVASANKHQVSACGRAYHRGPPGSRWCDLPAVDD